MSAPAPIAPADRFARLIEGLCRAVAERSAASRPTLPLMILVWSRLRRMAVRFAALAARIRAGRLDNPAAGRRRTAARRPDATRPPRPPPQRLPAGAAWLVRLVPKAASSASQLRHLLDDPEMAALIAAAPQMGRLLRPLCRMLGVRPPPCLQASATAAPTSCPAAPERTLPAPCPPDKRPRPRRKAGGLVPLARRYACGPPLPG